MNINRLPASDLLNASNAADSDSDPISFRIEAVTTGTLEKSSGGSWSSVTPGSTLIEANDTVRWKGASNANGTLNAFTLKAYDGDLTSTSAVQVTVQVSAVNDAPTITSPAIKEYNWASISGNNIKWASGSYALQKSDYSSMTEEEFILEGFRQILELSSSIVALLLNTAADILKSETKPVCMLSQM